MEEAAVSQSCTRDIFSIDIATVVLSRRAVSILTEASCAAPAVHRSNLYSITGLSASSLISSSPCGQLSPPPDSSACFSHASPSPSWADGVSSCRSRERYLDANASSTANKRAAPGDPTARSSSPLRVLTSAAVSEFLRERGEGTAAHRSETRAHGQSCSSTGSMPVLGDADAEESVDNTLWSTQVGVSCNRSTTICPPSLDSSERYEARDRWRQNAGSCPPASEREHPTGSEPSTSFTAVSSHRRGNSQSSNSDASHVRTDRQEKQTQTSSRRGNDSAGSLQCHKTARSSQVVRSTQTAPQKETYLCFPAEHEEGYSRKQTDRHQCHTEQVYNFLGTAFTATRSSLYVCVPLDAREDANSLGCTHTWPDSDTAGKEGNADTTCRAEGSAGNVPPVTTAASSHEENRNNFVSGGFPEQEAPFLTEGCATAAKTNAAACGTAVDAEPDSAASLASSATASCVSPACFSAIPRAAADVEPVSLAPSESLQHGSRQIWSKRKTSSAALLQGSGLRCTYIQRDPRQPIVTPTCDVFRLLHHLYAFFARCAASFTPFAADVYVVPVWKNPSVKDAGAAASGPAISIPAGAAERQPATGEIISAETVTLAGASTSANAAAVRGNAAAGERGAGDGPTPSSFAPAPDAQLATTLLAASGRMAEAADELDRDICGWQHRFLQALRSHCRSCRGIRMTGKQIVNVVDTGFELVDRTFAFSSSGAEDFAAHSCVLPVKVLHACRVQPFAQLLSLLKIPPAPTTIPAEKRTQRAASSEVVKQPTKDSGAEVRVERGDTKEAAPIDGAALCVAETADDTEDALHEEARTAAANCPVEASGPSPVAREPAVVDAAGNVIARATGVADACAAGAAIFMETEGRAVVSGDTASDGTATTAERRTGLVDRRRPFSGPAVSQFPHVIVAGTFDRLHAGHKLLLTVAALLSSDSLGIGTTAGALIQKKVVGDAAEAAAAVQTFAARAHAAAAFVALIATAARATSSPAGATNQTRSVCSGVTPASVACAGRRGHAVSAAGYDEAAAAATAGAEDGSLSETAFGGGGEAGASHESSKEWRNIEPGVRTVAEVKQGTPRAAHPAATALEGAAGRKGASTRLKTVLANEGGVEITRRTATARSVRFVNYCQTVVHDEVFTDESTQAPSYVRCDCAYRPAARLNAQGHTCTAATQNEGIDRTTVGKATATTAEQQCFREKGEEQERRRAGGSIKEDTRDAAEMYASDAIELEGRCQISRLDGDENRPKTPAAKSGRVVDASDGEKGQCSRREITPARKTSLKLNRKRSDESGLPEGRCEELLDVEEQRREQEVEEEGREKQWRELICEAVAETESNEALLRTPQDSDISSPLVALARENTYNVRSAESAWTNIDTRKPTRSVGAYVHSECDHVLLPWTSCVLPPNFSFWGRSRAAHRRLRASSGVATHLLRKQVANKSGSDAGLAASICSCPAGADAHPSIVTTSASVSASPLLVASSTSSSAASSDTAGSQSFSKRDASIVLPSSSLPTFPAPKPESHTTSPIATALSVERGITLASLSCSSAASEHTAPNRPAYFLPSCSGNPLRVHLMSLEDRLGPAGDLDFDALVVSSESLAGGFYVNEERIKRSRIPVCLVEVPTLSPLSEPVAHAQAASIVEEQDLLRRQMRSPTGKPAYHVLALGGSPAHFERAPVPLLGGNTALSEQISDARECGGLRSQVGRSHRGTHMYASAESAYGQHLKSASLLQDKPLKDHQIFSHSSEMNTSTPAEKTGVSKLNAVKFIHTIQGLSGLHREKGLCTGREKRFTEEFCECYTSGNRGQEREASASMTYATSAGVSNKTKQVKTNSLKAPPDMIDKLSSSHLRQQQATVLQTHVDIAFLRRRFADAATVVFRAPTPVWRAYWSMMCSLYVAPWRRLFTFERLARLLKHLDSLRERISGLSCFGVVCDAIVILSLCFSYAVHPPPGLDYCRFPKYFTAVAASLILTPSSGYSEETPTWNSCSWALQADWSGQTHSSKPDYKCRGIKAGVNGGGDTPGSGDSRAPPKEPVVEDELFVNEQLMHGFMRDASVCSRLRLYCRGGRFAEPSPVSGITGERNIVANDYTAAVLQEPSQINVNLARRVEGDLQSAEVLPRAADVKIFQILISCMRTARECCGFLLPRGSSSITWNSRVSKPACEYFREEKELLVEPRRSDCTGEFCLPKHAGDRLQSEAESLNGTSVSRLQQLGSQCCHVVRMLELLELAVPAVVYDRYARRMREEYYHMCDCHYACHRKEQLQGLQRQLLGSADGLTEAEVGLIRQNLAREELSLNVDDRIQHVKGTSTFACACGG